MNIREVGADDDETLGRCVSLFQAASDEDSPWFHPWSEQDYRVVARQGMDGEPPVIHVGEEDGRVVAHCDTWLHGRDNLHLAWLRLSVHPDHRGRGLGSRLVEQVMADARARGRTLVGADGWDTDGVAAFAARHGFAAKAAEVCRRQHLSEIDQLAVKQLLEESAEAASAYELVRIRTRTPEPLIDAVVEMVAAINDAPTDDLDIEDEVFSRDRVWAFEDAQRDRDRRLYRLVARHLETGALAGNTVVSVSAERPTAAHQLDTSVVRAHRGHRLGALLKASMVAWLAEEEPQVETVDTWNAESNEHMIGINQALGYRVMGRRIGYQRAL